MKSYPFFKYNMNIKTFFMFIVCFAILSLGLYFLLPLSHSVFGNFLVYIPFLARILFTY